MARVLQVITTTRRRGAEVFATDLGPALADRGWQVDTVALEGGGTAADELEVPSLGTRRLEPAAFRRLRRLVRAADVVIAHGSSSLVATAAATAATGTPFVYRSVGDPAHWTPPGLRRLRSTALLRRASAVVVLWPGAAATLAERRGIRRERLRVIPNGVPAARCHVAGADERRAARASLDLPSAGPVLAIVGALGPEKRIDRAIAATAARDAVHLVVVGDGPLAADLQALARRRASGRVTFTGALADVRPVYAAADAVVLASRTEGVPGVLIEAGLSGVPAVATDVGGVGEVVVHGHTGVLVGADGGGLAEGIDAVLRDRDRLAVAARDHCLQRFELAAVADRWHEVLDGVRR